MANEFIARNGIIAKSDSVISGSLTVTGIINGTITGSITSASIAVTSSFAESASLSNTASYVNPLIQPVTVTGSLNITGSTTTTSLTASAAVVGDLAILGTASISYLNVTYQSSSIIYSTGSNQFGDAANDTQTLYGTVRIPTGSFTVTGSSFMTGSLTVTGGITGSLFGTSSLALTSSYVNPLTQNLTLTGSFNTNTPSSTGVRERLLTATVSDATGDLFFINNGTILDGAFAPVFGGIMTTANANNLFGLGFQGFTTSALDTTQGNYGIVDFAAMQTTNASDPLNGTLSNVTSRKLFTFRGLNQTNSYLTIFAGGNVNIGGSNPTDSGFKLDINGTGRFSGNLTITGSASNSLLVKSSGATSSTFAAYFVNSSNQETFQVRDDGAVKIGAGSYAHPSITRFQINDLSGNSIVRIDPSLIQVPAELSNIGSTSLTVSGNSSLTLRPGNGNIGTISIGGSQVNSVAYTNTTRNFIDVNQGWNAVSGSGNLTMNALTLSNNINFVSSSGTNLARGLYINPTLTSVPNYRAIETTSGSVIFNGGNVGIGTSAPSASLHVSGTFIVDNQQIDAASIWFMS